jgi:phage-related protein
VGPIAVGDLVVANYQYVYQGVLLGSGTNYRTEKVEGLLSMPDLEVFDSDRNDDHGAYVGRSLLRPRIVQMDVAVLMETLATMTDMETALRTLSTALNPLPGRTTAQLVFQRPGTGKRYVNARCTRRSFPSTYEVPHGLARGAIEFKCADPRIYSLTETSVAIVLTGVSSNSGTVTNGGDFPHRPVLEILGPAVNPRISNAQDGNKSIKVDITLSAAETLIIDTFNRTVTLAGANRYDVVRNDNQWWELKPGANTITMNRTGTTGNATLTVKERDTWL